MADPQRSAPATGPRPRPSRRIDLLDRALYEDDPQHTQETYRWLRREAPLYRDEDNGLWAVSRHADVVAISRDPARFASGEGSRPNTAGSGSMIDSDDPRHRAYRRVFAKHITPRAVKRFEARVRRIVDDLFARLEGRREFDLVAELAVPLPVRVILEALGLDDADWPRYAHIAEITMAAGGGPRYQSDEVMGVAADFYGEACREVAKRREQPRDDWLGLITQRADDGSVPRSDLELAAESLLLLNGGSDTTRHVIAGGTLALLEHPEQLAMLRAEQQRLPVAIEEMVRWVSPLLNMRRTATEDVALHGETIRAGDQVLLLYAAADRDEAVFDDPQRFDVTRWPNPHLAFGIGAHFCMGANIARMELRCVFEAILQRLPGLERADDAPLEISAPAFACGLRSLPVRVTGR